jgi:hypothetical protein
MAKKVRPNKSFKPTPLRGLIPALGGFRTMMFVASAMVRCKNSSGSRVGQEESLSVRLLCSSRPTKIVRTTMLILLDQQAAEHALHQIRCAQG